MTLVKLEGRDTVLYRLYPTGYMMGQRDSVEGKEERGGDVLYMFLLALVQVVDRYRRSYRSARG